MRNESTNKLLPNALTVHWFVAYVILFDIFLVFINPALVSLIDPGYVLAWGFVYFFIWLVPILFFPILVKSIYNKKSSKKIAILLAALSIPYSIVVILFCGFTFGILYILCSHSFDRIMLDNIFILNTLYLILFGVILTYKMMRSSDSICRCLFSNKRNRNSQKQVTPPGKP